MSYGKSSMLETFGAPQRVCRENAPSLFAHDGQIPVCLGLSLLPSSFFTAELTYTLHLSILRAEFHPIAANFSQW
jgi:hypothetical protein